MVDILVSEKLLTEVMRRKGNLRLLLARSPTLKSKPNLIKFA